MNTDLSKAKIYTSLLHILYLIFFASIIFSFRGITSICLGIMLLTGIIINRSALTSFFQKNPGNFYLAGCIILFLLQLLSIFYTTDKQQGWTDIRIKAGLVITPLAACLLVFTNKNKENILLKQYCLLLTAASLYCLCISFLRFRETGSTSTFFYHDLVKPIKQHAVYFSVLIAVGLIFLLEILLKKDFFFSRLLHICVIIYLSAFLFLLSSKLVILFYIFFLVYYFFRLLKKEKTSRLATTIALILCSIFLIFLFIIRNPVSERFRDILKGDIKVVTQKSFTEGNYFNGLQFRLLQWRFVAEILTENKKWWLGVSPGDAQTYLNKKYLSKHLYAGDPSRGDHGYLIYNTHNQFLETLLQNGIIGLVVLIGICFFVSKLAVQKKNRIAIVVTFLLLIWLFTESVFETQYGIVIFTFFPLFIVASSGQLPLQQPKANLLKTNSDI